MNWKISIKNWFNQIGKIITTPERSLPIQIKKLLSSDADYFAWLIQHKLYCRTFKSLPSKKPFFSILMPVFNTDATWLKMAINSVLDQYFINWELIICDDASTKEETKQILKQFTALDRRILLITHEKNQGIAESTNHAAALATGQFLAFLDHDDLLYPDALAVMYTAMQQNQQGSVFYSDEDRMSPQGFRYQHNFKPGFSPSLLETHNYILHLMCIKTDAFQRAGGMRQLCDGSQDFDLLLRLFDQQATFVHVPDILYSWGESTTSMVGGQMKAEIFVSGKRALVDHLKRRNEQAEILDSPYENFHGHYWIRWKLPTSIRILMIKTGFAAAPFDLPLPDLPIRYQVTLIKVNNISEYIQSIQLNQYDIVIFLQAGIYPEKWELWLDELCGWALRKDVAIVTGNTLKNPEKRVIHAGISLLPDGNIIHDFKDFPSQGNTLLQRMRDCFAVQGLQMAISVSHLDKLLQNQIVNPDSWDVELCLRAQQQNWRIVCNPYATAYFYGDCNLLPQITQQAIQVLLQPNQRDHYLNPNLISDWRDKRLPPQLPRKEPEFDPSIIQTPAWVSRNYSDFTSHLAYYPFFSIILTTYNSNLLYLKEMLESIYQQNYTHFEVCISDDASDDPQLQQFLQTINHVDSRFKINFATTRGGIAANTNRCLAMVQGDFLVFCDHDDRLEPYALTELAIYINQHPTIDIIYSDEDQIDIENKRDNPHFRSNWNPDLFTSQMYFPHLVSIRNSLLINNNIQLDPELDGAQDYDLLLRLTELTQNIGHIPKVLYSWRCHDNSVALNANAKSYAYAAGRQALANAMQRRGEKAIVINALGTALGVYRVKRQVRPTTVSHIIYAQTDLVFSAIQSILLLTTQSIEIIIVIEKNRHDLITKIQQRFSPIQIVLVADNLGQAACYNAGAAVATSEILFFSPDIVEIIDSEYPNAALEHTQRADIGVVGSKLIYPNGTFYHTGILLGVNGLCGYAHRFMWQGPGYWFYTQSIRNYSAVSWDLMAVKRCYWESVGGFDTTLLRFADVDFCLKLNQLRHVYTPYLCGVLKHNVHHLEELRCDQSAAILRERYNPLIDNDYYYHPLLSRQWENFALRCFDPLE